MKIWVHRYQLKPQDKRYKARDGALVKVEWAIDQLGYSDLHPWPEYGEAPIEDQIKSLASLQMTELAENSLEANYIDREYRLNKKNAFGGLILPRAHRLVTDIHKLDPVELREWQKQGFSHIKVKMGEDVAAETSKLIEMAYATSLMWRLDFNGKLKADDFTTWWHALDNAVKARVDFIEDPTSGEQLKIPGPWANDWQKQGRAQIRILKPARESLEELAKYDRMVFTHGMDHTLAQAYAAWAAGRFYSSHPRKMEVCGLAAPSIYEPDDFSKLWSNEGPRLKPTTGMGFGFDAILTAISWERIL